MTDAALQPGAREVDAPPADPIAFFRELMAQAAAVDRARLPDPTAMALATADASGHPSVRIVLLKGVDARGFTFYTNLGSRKARELTENPHAALCFYWAPLDRQVRVEGAIERVSDAEADAYFVTRARMSQIGAWASRQSTTLAGDAELAERVHAMETRFAGRDVPRPEFWSGFRLVPHRMEFWRNRDYRLHERLQYDRDGDGWRVRRLFP